MRYLLTNYNASIQNSSNYIRLDIILEQTNKTSELYFFKVVNFKLNFANAHNISLGLDFDKLKIHLDNIFSFFDINSFDNITNKVELKDSYREEKIEEFLKSNIQF